MRFTVTASYSSAIKGQQTMIDKETANRILDELKRDASRLGVESDRIKAARCAAQLSKALNDSERGVIYMHATRSQSRRYGL